MDKLRALIIDDEANAVQLLESLLEEECPHIEVVGNAHSLRSGVAQIEKMQPDVLFLDIRMPDGDGFQLLERIDRSRLQVVFTTAYDAYAARAFEYAAVHYLLKPIDSQALKESEQRLLRNQPDMLLNEIQLKTLDSNLRNQGRMLALPNKNGFDMVEIEEIIRCEASENYTYFYLRDRRSLLISKPMHKYEALLADKQFFRVHRKHLVNLAHVRSYKKGKPGFLIMQDGSSVEVSVRRKDELQIELEQLIRF